MSSFSIQRRDAGIALLTLDVPGAPVNTLSASLIDEFEREVLPLLDDPGVRGVVLASGKPSTFIAGADLKELERVATADQAEAFSRRGQRLLNQISAARKPVVAAIHGACLGGGLEVALACSYLLASDDPATVLALPEVLLGLLPGAGGTQRLPRRIGLPAALPMMLTGQRVRAAKAYRMGLVDALTTPGGIAETGVRAALALADGSIRAGRDLSARVRMLTYTPLRSAVLATARKQVIARTRSLYPAPLAILECTRTGLEQGMPAGQDAESREFGRLAVSRPARALIFLFHAGNALKKAPDGAEPRPVNRLGVVGGGFMGAGIASVSLAHVPVVVKEVSLAALSGTARTVHDGLAKQLRSRAIRRVERDRRLSRLQLSEQTADLRGCELIVEAVFEDLELKRRVISEIEAVVADEAVIASNTSALPIAQIAAATRHPERVLGMHYFSPVPKMPLLELVVADATAPWAVDTARAFAVRQGKTVIVVRDRPGFYTTRILSAYLNEAMLVLAEGAAIDDVDRAMKDFGFPVGPLALLDEVGIDVGAHVASDLGAAFAERGLSSSDALPRLHEAGHLGRKNRKGFYLYPPDESKEKKRVNTEVYAFFGGSERKEVSREAIATRLGLIMVNEAAHCLAEGVIASALDGDVGAVMGLGFPPFSGGPFHYVDEIGAEQIVARLDRLAEKHGARFAPAAPLRAAAGSGTRFFPAPVPAATAD